MGERANINWCWHFVNIDQYVAVFQTIQKGSKAPVFWLDSFLNDGAALGYYSAFFWAPV